MPPCYAHVLKLRPVCRAPGHLGDEDWKTLLAEQGLILDGDIPRLRHPSACAWPGFKGWIRKELDGFSSADYLVVDACISESDPVLRYCIESLADALLELLTNERRGFAKILIVTGCSSASAYEIFDIVGESGHLYGKVWAMTVDGDLYGCSGESVFAALASALKPMIDPDGERVCLRRIQANLLRQLGVYKDSAHEDNYFVYRYVLERDGHHDAATLINRYILERDIEHVLIDTTSSYWMNDVAKHLVVPDGHVIVTSVGTVDQETVDLLASASRGILLLCGATLGGHTAVRLCRDYRLHQNAPNLFRVALMCDAGNAAQDGVWKRIAFGDGDWDYLLNVPIKSFSSSDWMVQVAMLLDDIRDLGVPPGEVTLEDLRVDDSDESGCPVTEAGLWQLLAQVGAGPEASCGADMQWRDKKRAVRYLPRLWAIDIDPAQIESDDVGSSVSVTDRMDNYDANWLAEAIIRRFCKETKRTNRQNLVVVVPERRTVGTESAVEKVLEAMVHTRRVKALKLGRDVIHSAVSTLEGRDVESTSLWRSDAFVVFDETAVSLSTISGITRLLHRSGHSVSASAALVDVGWSGRAEEIGKFFSLACWDHIAEIGDHHACP